MKQTTFTKPTAIVCKKWLILVLFLTFASSGFAQQLITGGNMESSTGWNVFRLDPTNPAATYQFNYTAQKPAQGKDGCLRVTSTGKTNMLFWQKIKLKANRTYILDGAVRTGNVASFWCEWYLSTVAPKDSVDYSPNGNGDVVLGLSTWAGCGPNLNGQFSKIACTGKKMYKPAGVENQDVEVYFAIKTGTIANPLPAPLEVLIDEISLKMILDSTLVSTKEGVLDSVNFKITQVRPSITVEKFRGGLQAAATATISIIGKASGLPILNPKTTLLSDTMAVKIAGNGTSLYSIEFRAVSGQNQLIASSLGSLDTTSSTVTNLPDNARVIQLKSSLSVSPFATFTVLDASNQSVSDYSPISANQHILVTAEDSSTKSYAIQLGGAALPTESATSLKDSVESIKHTILSLSGNSELHITSSQNPLEGSLLNLQSDNIWLYFDNIRPSIVKAKYLSHILINGDSALIDQNIRLVQYLQGSVLITQPSTYTPLTLFSGDDHTGSSQELGIYTYYRATELGALNDAVHSFKLKKGYMATFAQNANGTGYSRVYIADKADVLISKLPKGLYDSVSFVRVIPWRWVAKKGWTSGKEAAEALNCSWQYDWDNYVSSSLDVEYVPMRHNQHWNSFENINIKKNSTHVLGFNEPERPDQSNMTVNDALALWPELLKSGLRLGSPSPSDAGLEWLFQFMDRCDALNYRVDYVAVHWYMGGQTAKQFYDRLKYIHDRTKRPLWVTEWNNGANWTCCKPTYAQNAKAIAEMTHMLDTTSFVERYSLYEWVEDTRQMFSSAPTVLTPAGEVYRDNLSPMAYEEGRAFIRDYTTPPVPVVPPTEFIGAGKGFELGRTLSIDIDSDGDLDMIYSGMNPTMGGVLRNDGQGNYTSTGQALQGLFIPGMNAGDVDGDGDMDVIISGWDKDHGWAAYGRILRNDGTGLFTLETPPAVNCPVAGFGDFDNNGFLDYYMIGNGNKNKFYFQRSGGFDAPVNRVNNAINIQDPDASTVDIDNDQDVDFCVQAWNTAGRRYTQLWKNDGNGMFIEQTVPFKQKHWGSSQYADIDSDGDLDMLINGDGDANSDAGSSDIYRLYINDGAGNMTEGAIFQKYRQNANGKGSSFVDWDNDGDYDIILTGSSLTENREVANIFLNDGTGVFTRSPESDKIPGISRGTIELGDANGDGKVDLFLTGYSGGSFGRTVGFLIKNEAAKANTPPSAPTTLKAVVKGDSVSFSWSAGSDAETNAKALTYSIYVKDANGKYLIFPNANIATGKRMVVGLGNAYQNVGWHLKRLPKGVYTWGVQTVDAGYTGSEFTPKVTFTIGLDDVCQATGTILRETWVKVNGYDVRTIPVDTPPTATRQLTKFEGPFNVTNYYGDRIRGYIYPPISGNYTFWIASDDNGALYLSSDDQPANKQRIAWVNGTTNPQQWTKFTSQQSAPIYLEACKKYYIESLHKEVLGTDHVAVGWQLPDGTLERPIPGNRLSPFTLPNARWDGSEEKGTPPASLHAAPNPFSASTQIRFKAEASGKATIGVYDLNGSLVKVLFDGELEEGETKELTLEGTALSSGIYLIKANSASKVSRLKLVLTR